MMQCQGSSWYAVGMHATGCSSMAAGQTYYPRHIASLPVPDIIPFVVLLLFLQAAIKVAV